jgi:hypothetical protein
MASTYTPTTPNYDEYYKDGRLDQVNTDRQLAKDESNAVYDGMISSADKYYDDLKDQTQQWADKQAQIQQEQTDFAIEKIEQQKEQAEKDYLKEQSASYVDWQKQSNKYGTEAEKMASAGLTDSGYSESSQVSMYNTYQNRVATAREVLAQAKLNYDNGIKEAMLQNSAAIAEIYANCYLEQAKIALEGFQHKNELVLAKANQQIQLDEMYHNRYMDIYNQINQEVSMAEDIRQYNESMKWNTEQKELDRQHDKEMKEIQYNYDVKLQEIQHGYDKELASIEQNYKLAYLNAQTEKEKEILKIQHQNDIAKLNQQLANEKALLKYEYDLKKTQITSSGGSSGGSSKSSSGSSGTKITGGGSGSVSGSSNMSVNTKSKLSLGKGAISDKKAAQLVNEGKATATVKNGQVYVAPATYIPTKLQQLQSNLPKRSTYDKRADQTYRWGAMK